jgi:hypothetical protein
MNFPEHLQRKLHSDKSTSHHPLNLTGKLLNKIRCNPTFNVSKTTGIENKNGAREKEIKPILY